MSIQALMPRILTLKINQGTKFTKPYKAHMWWWQWPGGLSPSFPSKQVRVGGSGLVAFPLLSPPNKLGWEAVAWWPFPFFLLPIVPPHSLRTPIFFFFFPQGGPWSQATWHVNNKPTEKMYFHTITFQEDTHLYSHMFLLVMFKLLLCRY